MPKISVIVPVYNSQKYLEKCVNSILSQSIIDIEVILIDDGSSDDSGKLCDRYGKKDNRIKVIHQENKGVSAARNIGLKLATGDFINFLDSDDFLDKDMLEILYENALQFHSDISICSIKSNRGQYLEEFNNKLTMSRDEALIGLINGKLNWSANNKLFVSSLAKGEMFEGSINEDLLYCFKVFKKATSYVFQDVGKYNYNINENSVSMSEFSMKYMQIPKVAAEILAQVNIEKTELFNSAKYNDIIANISIINLILLSNKENFSIELNKSIERLKKYSDFIKSNKKILFKHKMAFMLISLNLRLYKCFLYFYCKLTGANVLNRI